MQCGHSIADHVNDEGHCLLNDRHCSAFVASSPSLNEVLPTADQIDQAKALLARAGLAVVAPTQSLVADIADTFVRMYAAWDWQLRQFDLAQMAVDVVRRAGGLPLRGSAPDSPTAPAAAPSAPTPT